MSNPKKKLIAVVGPTGAGKTALAVKLAQQFDGVIISADSRQVYRGLDIGTNKEGQPGFWAGEKARIIDGIPQLLTDVAEPGLRFTLADWLLLARTKTEQIWRRGLVPIVVGGTGLYVTALVDGYQPGEGRYSKKRQSVDFETLQIMTDVPRAKLYEKSDRRCDRVFDVVTSEIKQILSQGISAEWLIAIGLDYRYGACFLQEKLGREETIAQFQKASRAYIRRQLTWWRSHGPVISVKSEEEAIDQVRHFLNKAEKTVM